MGSCKKSAVETHQTFHENGNLKEEYLRKTKDYAKHGLYTKYYPDGTTFLERATFENDTLHGWYVIYFENGDTQSVAMMKKGLYDGPFREYYKNGNLMQSYHHVNDKIKGTFLEYYETGELKGKLLFDNNNENGPFVEYHVNGKKAWEGTFLNGKETGELLKYNEEGELIRKLNCQIQMIGDREKSICTTTWVKEGYEDEEDSQ